MTDLIRRLDAAISSKSLHPNYARELLKEAREAIENPRPYIPLAGRAIPKNLFAFAEEDTDEPT